MIIVFIYLVLFLLFEDDIIWFIFYFIICMLYYVDKNINTYILNILIFNNEKILYHKNYEICFCNNAAMKENCNIIFPFKNLNLLPL